MAIQDDLAKADKSKSAKKKYMSVQESLAGADKSKSARKNVSSSKPMSTAKKAVDKSGYNKNIKVSQAQIDAVKKLGMAGAIKSAGSMSPAMREAATRLYGAKRIGAASASKPAAKSGNSSNYGMGAGKPAMAKKGTPKTGAARAAFSTGSSTSKASTTQKTKSLKNNPLAKFVTSRVGGKSGGM